MFVKTSGTMVSADLGCSSKHSNDDIGYYLLLCKGDKALKIVVGKVSL